MDREKDPIYELDGKISFEKAIPFGLQHVLAMFVANIAPILIVAGAVKLSTEETPPTHQIKPTHSFSH